MTSEKHLQDVRMYVSHIQLSVLMQFSLLCALVLLSNYVLVDEDIKRTQESIEGISTPLHRDPFGSLDIEAQGVYVFDVVNNEVLYAKNENNVYPLASITKIATALTAEKLATGDTTVNLSPESIRIEGDNGLLPQEKWKLSDLRDFTLLVSSNDGAHGIAAVAGAQINSEGDTVKTFVDEMNDLAQEIGLTKTRFYNPSGLDETNTRSGAYGSARDVAQLMSYVLTNNPEIVEKTKELDATFVSLDNLIHHATNTNPSVTRIPGLLASKTGYTELSGGNLVIAFDPFPGRPIVIAVLGSSYDGRFKDVEQLSQAAVAAIRQQ